jgi:hypothetical protein
VLFVRLSAASPSNRHIADSAKGLAAEFAGGNEQARTCGHFEAMPYRESVLYPSKTIGIRGSLYLFAYYVYDSGPPVQINNEE